jgi:hypothetical protein
MNKESGVKLIDAFNYLKTQSASNELSNIRSMPTMNDFQQNIMPQLTNILNSQNVNPTMKNHIKSIDVFLVAFINYINQIKLFDNLIKAKDLEQFLNIAQEAFDHIQTFFDIPDKGDKADKINLKEYIDNELFKSSINTYSYIFDQEILIVMGINQLSSFINFESVKKNYNLESFNLLNMELLSKFLKAMSKLCQLIKESAQSAQSVQTRQLEQQIKSVKSAKSVKKLMSNNEITNTNDIHDTHDTHDINEIKNLLLCKDENVSESESTDISISDCEDSDINLDSNSDSESDINLNKDMMKILEVD